MTYNEYMMESVCSALDELIGGGTLTEEQADEVFNLAFEKYICEARNLSKEFRMVIGKNNGHLYKVVYDLNPDNITSDNLYQGKPLEDLKKNIKSTGHSNYTSKGNKIVAIVDMCTNKRVSSIDAMPPIHNSGGDIMPVTLKRFKSIMSNFLSDKEVDKYVDKYSKECPTGILPNPGYKFAIKKSIEKGQKPIKYTVGKTDDTDTYKTTDIKKVTKGMLNLDK